MSIQQISVFLENRPGQLLEMTSVLAENKIDLRALSLAETEDFGIARIITDDAYETASVLKDHGFVAKFSHVMVFAVPDEPGGLATLLQAFTEAEINIEYMYAFLGGKDAQHAYMIFKVTGSEKAEAKLYALKGIRPLTQEDIANI